MSTLDVRERDEVSTFFLGAEKDGGVVVDKSVP
jgi:hypothetical protein